MGYRRGWLGLGEMARDGPGYDSLSIDSQLASEVDGQASTAAEEAVAAAPVAARRGLGWGFLRPSHQHTAMSAALLLGFFALVSRVIGLVRDKYIAYKFGAGASMDAYNVAFQLPDLINYLLVGGAASISFVTILSRYRERGEVEEGDRALLVILNTMALVLGGAILLAELLTPLYTDRFFARGTAEAALCTEMTRILLPAQLFFFAGGVLASVALVRKQFTYQAVSPLVYTLGIIGGGVALAGTLGIPSLAWGALAGSVLGPFLVNGFAAWRAGVRYRPVLDFGNRGLRDWVRMSLPLMLGVSVVFLDNYILTWFAKQTTGEISKLMYAKRLFTAPMAIIGQAAGAASLPFFASLHSKGLHQDYREAVNRSVSRILSVAFLLAAAMFGLAGPIVDLVYRGGAFGRQDAAQTTMYFAIFTLSLPMWASQAIYARAFFAVGETRAPMIGGTVLTALSIPMYWLLHARFGVAGLAWASNLAILAQTVMLAVLAHRRHLVPLFGLDVPELERSLLSAFVSFAGLHLLDHVMPAATTHFLALAELVAGVAVWGALAAATLHLTGSKMVGELRRRFA